MLFLKSIRKHTRIYLWKRLVFIVIVIGVLTFYYFLDQTSNDDCHYLIEGDILQSTEDLDFMPLANSIFFHETSCEGNLRPRQACAVEAAARRHPEKEVYVLFSAPVSNMSFEKSSLRKLSILKNVRFARVHIKEYAKFTPLENMVAERPFRKSKWWKEHTSDILKYLTLYKYGGVYLDTDMFVIRNLSPLGRNWVAMKDIRSVHGAAIAMSSDKVGRHFIETLLTLVNAAYRSGDLDVHSDSLIGPDALHQVLNKLCNTSKVSQWSEKTCEGLIVYNWDYFYPVHEMYHAEYFRLGSLEEDDLVSNNSYAYHLWNRHSFNMTVEQESPLSTMVPFNCPTIYQMSGEQFGSQTDIINVL